MHKSPPLYDTPFDLGMLDPVECPPTPKLAYATTTIRSPLPMKPLALQQRSREPSRSPSPLSPITPTSESSGRSSPSTDSDGDLLAPQTLEDNANDVGKAQPLFAGLRHTEIPPPRKTLSHFHAAVRSVPGHVRKCSLGVSCHTLRASPNTSARRHVLAAPYPVPYARILRHRTEAYMRDHCRFSQYQGHVIVYETPRPRASPLRRVDMPAVNEWLKGISLYPGDELTRQLPESPEKDEHARLTSDSEKTPQERPKAQLKDDSCEDPPSPPPSIKLINAEYSDSEDEGTVYYTSYDASTDIQEEEETLCVLLTPDEQKDVLDIQDAEWEELFQDLVAATAQPLRRRLRPGEWNAPLVPSPLSMDPDCADEIVDTVLPTYAKGVWPSYRRGMSLVEAEPYR
ncbi:hypothetical protein FOMPIDRAFT_83332 [Fomitopsis schrenkii]|uniref:Uncharacterized protein n=1 Tax=Fomitopsis schrenkii TaxID=2126942 RepID=S8FT17_FOMSC|nr:hypothetical protein FOMPIDRAFT_83332 [Fomitopsis schrenkii]